MNLVVYGIIYIGLTYAFLNSFDRSHGHLYAPRGLFTIILLAIIMFDERGVADSLGCVIYYAVEIVLRFASRPEMRD